MHSLALGDLLHGKGLWQKTVPASRGSSLVKDTSPETSNICCGVSQRRDVGCEDAEERTVCAWWAGGDGKEQ